MRDPKVGRLKALHAELEKCTVCPLMTGPPVHGPPIVTKIFLTGQAPGAYERIHGKPFAWTAGKTLFGWFERAFGITEEEFREHVYIAAIVRCYPGKAGHGDRRPLDTEIKNCSRFLSREVRILRPELVIPVGKLAIEQVLGITKPLVEVVGRRFQATWHGVDVDVIPLPHPSGASPWHKIEPGKSLLAQALKLIGRHPAMRKAFGLPSRVRR